MKHEIPTASIGPLGAPMAQAVQKCVHCGFCLPSCPTYQVLGQEQDSPRGRIILMKEVLEGNLPVEEAIKHIDQCLGCVACETACPSQVKYGDLISPFRAHVESKRRRGLMERLQRLLVSRTLPYPRRFRLAMRTARLLGPLNKLAPASFRPMLDMVPAKLPAKEKLQKIYPAQGSRRARVALLAGCAQQVLAPEINRATINVLVRNGVEVVVPRKQGCCGALAWHVGDGPTARKLARKNLTAFPADVDAIVTNAAGCGSGLHDYKTMFLGSDLQQQAAEFAERTQDVCRFLFHLGIERPGAFDSKRRVAIHDACHLVHAQQVRSEPRALLSQIGNIELVEIADSDLCCGSAGTYNIDQPKIAAELGLRKANTIIQSDCGTVVMGNIGCMIQIRQQLAKQQQAIEVMHTMQLLDQAYRG